MWRILSYTTTNLSTRDINHSTCEDRAILATAIDRTHYKGISANGNDGIVGDTQCFHIFNVSAFFTRVGITFPRIGAIIIIIATWFTNNIVWKKSFTCTENITREGRHRHCRRRAYLSIALDRDGTLSTAQQFIRHTFFYAMFSCFIVRLGNFESS